MKRFKDCCIYCTQGQSVSDLSHIIKSYCLEHSYEVEEQSTFACNDTLIIMFDTETLPVCKLILSLSKDDALIKIINIVPIHKTGITSLSKELYNEILDTFRDVVLSPIETRYGNKIIESASEYSIEDVIPISSSVLKRWLSAYPLSGHSYDQKRWFDFLISLIDNNETLSLDDFSQYIKENYDWTDQDIETFELKFEEELALLEYYNGRR